MKKKLVKKRMVRKRMMKEATSEWVDDEGGHK